LRFALALGPLNSTTAQEIYNGYRYWAEELNRIGGIPIGGGKHLKVELLVLQDILPADHVVALSQAVVQGATDFLLGGDTGRAQEDWTVAREHERITMLCCHGPPDVYKDAFTNAINDGAQNWLFGIHVSSEKYVDKIIRHIVVNGKAKKIALVSSINETDPTDPKQLFSRTTCQAAKNQLRLFRDEGRYLQTPKFYEIHLPAGLDEMKTREILRGNLTSSSMISLGVDQDRVDVIIGCTVDTTGKLLLDFLGKERVPLRAVFATVAPTNPISVKSLTSDNVTMEYVLSAGQWHPELAWSAESDSPQYLWQNASDFAQGFENFMRNSNGAMKNETAATYTHASAAAAAHAIQLAVANAFEFQNCSFADWDGSSEVFLNRQWSCSGDKADRVVESKTGLYRIHTALRSLSNSTFFGKISFDNNQRNNGRDAITFQLLQSDTRTSQVFGSIDFGPDAISGATLIQEVRSRLLLHPLAKNSQENPLRKKIHRYIF